jgi:hypothetical protein
MAISPLKSWGTQLAELQDVIDSVHTNQRYEINGRVFVSADLEQLQREKVYLVNKLETQGDVIAGSQIIRGNAQVSFTNE